MILLTPTVMHTGTNFLNQNLLKDWNTIILSRWKGKDKPGKNNIFTHVHDGKWDDVDFSFPCLVPMRHPARVYESWARRRKDLGMLNRQFSNLINVVHPNNPEYLIIDHPSRGERLRQINGRLHLDLETDWGVWTKKNTADVEITSHMRGRVPDFVMDFYNEII